MASKFLIYGLLCLLLFVAILWCVLNVTEIYNLDQWLNVTSFAVLRLL